MDLNINTQPKILKDDDDLNIEENCQSISQTDLTVNGMDEINEDNSKTTQENFKKDEKKRKKPNCFFSISINNENILDKLSVLLKRMVEVEADMKQISISLEKIHLTLGVFNLETESEIEGAKQAMQESLIEIKNLRLIFPTSIRLSGIDLFKSGVLFVKVTDSSQNKGDGMECGVDESNLVGMNTALKKEEDIKEGNMKEDEMKEDIMKEDTMKEDTMKEDTSSTKLAKIREILLEKFNEQGLMDASNYKPLILHATIAKASKARFHQQKKFKEMIKRISRVIDGEDYGLQAVSRIDLCWMSRTDHTTMGYQTIHSIDLV